MDSPYHPSITSPITTILTALYGLYYIPKLLV